MVGVIESDQAAMRVLRATADLGLPDWWIGAGFVRNRVWDAISDLSFFAGARRGCRLLRPEKLDPREDARAEAQAVSSPARGAVEIRKSSARCICAMATSPTRLP